MCSRGYLRGYQWMNLQNEEGLEVRLSLREVLQWWEFHGCISDSNPHLYGKWESGANEIKQNSQAWERKNAGCPRENVLILFEALCATYQLNKSRI